MADIGLEIALARATRLLDLALAEHDATYGRYAPTYHPLHWTHDTRKFLQEHGTIEEVSDE